MAHLRLDHYGPKDRSLPSWQEGNRELKGTVRPDMEVADVPRQGEVLSLVDRTLEEVRLYRVLWVVWTPDDGHIDAVLHLEEIYGLC